jgi:hypothetical protein
MGLSVEGMRKLMKLDKDAPHFVNLNEDPTLSDCLVYFFKEGATVIGQKSGDPQPDIMLGGVGIEPRHCVVENTSNSVKITALQGARVFVNGVPASPGDGVPMTHGDRVVLGHNFFFRYVNPVEYASKKRASSGGNDVNSGAAAGEPVDFEYALKELAQAQGIGISAEMEAKQKAMEAEAMKREEELQDQIAKLRAEMEREREAANDLLAMQQKALDEKLAAGEGEGAETQAMQEAMEKASRDAREREERMTAENEKLNLEKVRIQKDLELMKLNYSGLADELIRMIPMIHEINAIAGKLRKNMQYELKLMTVDTESENPLEAPTQGIEIVVKACSEMASIFWMWDYGEFENRMVLAREIFTYMMEYAELPEEGMGEDPFYSYGEEQLLGKCTVLLEPLKYGIPIDDTLPIVDHKGANVGSMELEIIPLGIELTEDPSEFLDQDLTLRIFVKGASGLPEDMCYRTFVRYKFYDRPDWHVSTPSTGKVKQPKWNFAVEDTVSVDQVFLDFLESRDLVLEVWYQQEEWMVNAIKSANAPMLVGNDKKKLKEENEAKTASEKKGKKTKEVGGEKNSKACVVQ